MSHRVCTVALAAALAIGGPAATLHADTRSLVVTHPYPGMTYIVRTDALPPFQCPGCGSPTPNPRLAMMNIVLIDLTAPEVRFKLTPRGTDLPPVLPGSTTPGWPVVPFETVRETTLGFLETSHAQVAINGHFFAPFPVPGGSTQGAFAYVIGLAASRGDVYSAFESPIQNYAIVTDAPAVNIDSANNASIVHRDPAFADGLHVLENVQLWNALAGSAQIVTNGVKTIPEYKDATHPDELLTPGPGSPPTYTRAGRHWYDLSNARSAIGLTQDNRTLVLFTVDGTNGGHGMQVGEVADLLMSDYGVWNALNLDGGGSATMAMQDPVTHQRRVVNALLAGERADASSLAVYADGLPPTTVAAVAPAPNANGWHTTPVTVTLNATDLRSGVLDTPPGWVDQVQYALAGAQPAPEQVIPGNTTTFDVSATGVTTVTYFATDAAGNDEAARTLDVRIDGAAPVITGMLVTGCTVWPVNHKIVPVAVITDAVSGFAPDGFQLSATSSEPSAPGQEDIVVTPDGSGGFVVGVRAERLGTGRGRVYTLAVTATDRAGNVATASGICTVPHDQRKK